MDIDQFTERAAIMEYCGGMDRFRAETLAAKEQGKSRSEFLNAIRMGHPAGRRDNRETLVGQQRADHLPKLQPDAQEKDRPVPVGHEKA